MTIIHKVYESIDFTLTFNRSVVLVYCKIISTDNEFFFSCVTILPIIEFHADLSQSMSFPWAINFEQQTSLISAFFFLFFSVRLLSVLRGHSVFSSRHNGQWPPTFAGFSIPDFIHYIYFPILILEKEPIFSLLSVQCETRALLVPFL